ncbi:MAG: crossover junction endodeoxyribonuclease RuvC [Clostridium sp.]|nr:crossover junction endodeoxyribonuclease RuvC [Clostridium sp.]
MEILGVDAATKKTGYGIINAETGALVDYGLIKTSSDDVRDRMKEIYFKLKEIIQRNDIKVVVVEDIPVNNHSNLKTGKDLSILHGVILGVCFEQCLPWVVYAPSSWRSVVGTYDGTREGTKREIQKQVAVDKVNKLYNLNLHYFVRDTKENQSDDDKAEAILIARSFYLNEKKED